MKTPAEMIPRIVLYIAAIIITLNLISTDLMAQDGKSFHMPKSITINEANFDLEGVQRVGFETVLQGDDNTIVKKIKSRIKEVYGLKMSSKAGYLFVDDQLNTALSDKHFSLKILVKEDGEGCHLRTWMSFGTDIYVSTSDYPTEAGKIKSFLREFVVDYYNAFIIEAIEDNTKELESIGKSLSKEKKHLASSEKTKSKLESKASKAEAKCKKLEAKIASIKEDITVEKQDVENYTKQAEKEASEIESVKLEVAEKQKLYDLKNSQLSELKLQMESLKNLK